MADMLRDVLSGYDFEQPPEIERIKRYVRDNFHADCHVSLRENAITIVVNSSALAGALRPKLHELQKRTKVTKRLIIRISR